MTTDNIYLMGIFGVLFLVPFTLSSMIFDSLDIIKIKMYILIVVVLLVLWETKGIITNSTGIINFEPINKIVRVISFFLLLILGIKYYVMVY